ncbi:hypothetical protein [Rubritalea tangerina]|uniref:hypothetical protein n=1 Tax=Rubritalea tangerina TaxID=430798 RepID=UPI003617BAD0
MRALDNECPLSFRDYYEDDEKGVKGFGILPEHRSVDSSGFWQLQFRSRDGKHQ